MLKNINLQLFSQDEGENLNNLNDNQDTSSKETSDNQIQSKTYTDEDIESLKQQWKKEKDREDEEKLKQGIQKAIEEERRLSKLSKEDKEKEERQKLLDEIENLKKERQLSNLKEKALSVLSEQKLPNSFLNFVLGEDENSTINNITNLKAEFDKAVQMQVEERLKGKTPVSGGNVDLQRNVETEFKNALRGTF